MNKDELISLLYVLCSLDLTDHAPVGRIRVKYRDDDFLYTHWVPRHANILADGLLDPGFSCGPLYYTDVDLVEVRLGDWIAEKGDSGRLEFAELREMLADQPGLEVGDDSVAWRNSDRVVVDSWDD